MESRFTLGGNNTHIVRSAWMTARRSYRHGITKPVCDRTRCQSAMSVRPIAVRKLRRKIRENQERMDITPHRRTSIAR